MREAVARATRTNRIHILSRRCNEVVASLCRRAIPANPKLFRSARRRNSQPQPRRDSVVTEGFHGGKRKFASRLSADRGKLFENVGGRRDDVTTHFVRFYHVKDLARGSPDDLDIASLPRTRNCVLYDRTIVDA